MIRYPELAAEPGAVSGARYAARQQQSRRPVDLPTADADCPPNQAHDLTADVVFQLAATGGVIQ